MMVFELMDYGDLLSFVKAHGSVRHTLLTYTCTVQAVHTYIRTYFLCTYMDATWNLTCPFEMINRPTKFRQAVLDYDDFYNFASDVSYHESCVCIALSVDIFH